jgi:hypothetical protein
MNACSAFRASLALALGSCALSATNAADPAPKPVTQSEAAQKRIDGKAARLIDGLKVADPLAAERAKATVASWLATLGTWHREHDAQLNALWSDWNKARAVVPKDEFPAEVIAHRIDDLYASLVPAREAFLAQLATHLSAEQVDAFKEAWSRSPGMKRTYNAYLEIVPDLSDADKKVIYDRMLQAREDALLTDSDKEIVTIYKRHKVKVEAYVGTLEWAKLHKAYANRAKKK